MNRILAIFAFAAIAVFLLILAFQVPSIDLIIVIAITLSFVAYDFFTSASDKKD